MENLSWVGCSCDFWLSEVLLSDHTAPSVPPILADTLGLARGDVSSEDVAEQSHIFAGTKQQCHGPYTRCLCQLTVQVCEVLWIKFLHKLGDIELHQNVRQSCPSPSQPIHIKGGGCVVAGAMLENGKFSCWGKYIWVYIYIDVVVTVLLTFPLQIVLIHTRKPAAKPIRASSSNFFFLVVLLIGLLLAFVPLAFSIAR